MSTQVILLERVEKLGNMGDVVAVKPGYARNYLLPQKKALRASKENVAYFEAQKKQLEADNAKARTDAEKRAKNVEGLKVPLIRQASESGHLYGSVNSNDIAKEVAALSKETITRAMVEVNQNFKQIGLFPVTIRLHPEVTVEVTINIARSTEEAEIQASTGRALIADAETVEPQAEVEADDAQLEEVLEESALQAEKEKQAAEAEAAAQKEAEDLAKAEAAAAEAEAQAAEEAAESDDSQETPESADAEEDSEKDA